MTRLFFQLLFISLLFPSIDSFSSFGIDERVYNHRTILSEKLLIDRPVLNYTYSFRMINSNSNSSIYDNIIPNCSIFSPFFKKTIIGVGFNASNRVPNITLKESSYKFVPGDFINGVDPLAYNYDYSIAGGVSKFYLVIMSRINKYVSSSLKGNVLFGNQNNSYIINYYDLDYNGDGYSYTATGSETINNNINFSGYQFDLENEIKLKKLSISLLVSILYNLKLVNTSNDNAYNLDTNAIRDIGISARYNLSKLNLLNLVILYTNPYIDYNNQDFSNLSNALLFRNANRNETIISLYNNKKFVYKNQSVDNVEFLYGLIYNNTQYFYIENRTDYNNRQNRYLYLGLKIDYMKQNSFSIDFLVGEGLSDLRNIIFNINFTNGLKRLKQIKKEN